MTTTPDQPRAEIQRYELTSHGEYSMRYDSLDEDPDGEWVRFADIAPIIAERDAALARVGEAERERDGALARGLSMAKAHDIVMNRLIHVEAERDRLAAELAGLRGVTESSCALVGVDYATHRDESVAVIARQLAKVRGESLKNTAVFLAELWTRIDEWWARGCALEGDKMKDHFLMQFPVLQTTRAQMRMRMLGRLSCERDKVAAEIAAALAAALSPKAADAGEGE